MKYIKSLHIDGRPTDKTYLPESIIRSGGELAFSLSLEPNKVWGTAESSAPPSFGAGSLAVTVNVSPAVVAMDAGTTDVTVNVQRMIDVPAPTRSPERPTSGDRGGADIRTVRRRRIAGATVADQGRAVGARRVLPARSHHQRRQ